MFENEIFAALDNGDLCFYFILIVRVVHERTVQNAWGLDAVVWNYDGFNRGNMQHATTNFILAQRADKQKTNELYVILFEWYRGGAGDSWVIRIKKALVKQNGVLVLLVRRHDT